MRMGAEMELRNLWLQVLELFFVFSKNTATGDSLRLSTNAENISVLLARTLAGQRWL
jgi:hypothetical protein